VGVWAVDAKRLINTVATPSNCPSVVVPEADNFEPMHTQMRITLRLGCESCPKAMLSAIDLDDKTRRVTSKINNQMIDGHLAAKVQPPSFERLKNCPKPTLCIGLTMTELAGASIGHAM